MITTSNSSVKRSGTPNQFLGVLLHTIAMSGLSRVRTELFPLLVIPSLQPRILPNGTFANPEKTRSDRLSAMTKFHRRWPEYLMEMGEVGVYLCVACLVWTLLQHPASIVRQFVSSGIVRRALMGLAMGATAIAIVISPWGKRSGGHFNPAITFAFYRLGKLSSYDMGFYVGAQFLGAIVGVAVARYALRGALGNHAVHYAVTVPGAYGAKVAFVAELAISFFLMITILFTTNHKKLAPYTAYANGALLAIYYTLEAPLSGMSTNPARTFGSAFQASYWHALWVYFIAPSMGMLAAAETFLRIRRGVAPYCAKLHHAYNERCIFRHAQQEDRFHGPIMVQ